MNIKNILRENAVHIINAFVFGYVPTGILTLFGIYLLYENNIGMFQQLSPISYLSGVMGAIAIFMISKKYGGHEE